MLGMRLEGDPDEARLFLAALRAAGAEVAIGTEKDRGHFFHVYATVRMPDTAATTPTAEGPRPTPAGRAVTGRRRR